MLVLWCLNSQITFSIKGLNQKCCTSNCLLEFDPYEVLKIRMSNLSTKELVNSDFIKSYIRQHINQGSILWMFAGIEVCQYAWMKLYGFSSSKFFAAKKQELAGTLMNQANNGLNFLLGIHATLHGNFLREYKKPKSISVASWISSYCEKYGDYVPTSKEVHLAANLT